MVICMQLYITSSLEKNFHGEGHRTEEEGNLVHDAIN